MARGDGRRYRIPPRYAGNLTVRWFQPHSRRPDLWKGPFDTMAILFPLVVPLAHELAPGDMNVMLGAISSVLAGAVWGDHCSPISDTTVLSSVASGCNHIEHVRTQLPYALLVGVVGLVFGTIPTGYGLPPWVSLIVGAAVLIAAHRYLGRKADA